jgi:hypothetical protein
MGLQANRTRLSPALAWLGIIVGAVTMLAGPGPAHAGDPPEVRFNRDIRPIMSDTCFKCHGPGTRKAGLRLDLRDEALKQTESGVTPIVPGKPEQSEVVRRVLATDRGEVMPPPDSHKTLSAEQKEIIRRWIAQGAVYEKHWAFETPAKAVPPQVAGPAFRIRNPIDAFIADRLRREGLTMSAEADRETLIRRVAFATTGLPPTPKEVDAFVADASADAYEKMLDRYLASERFGEEMARHWLDVARYADTHGLHLDNEREMWAYRDWVIRAFNQDKPFDQFTIEQLAGDLLPNATPEQLTATGFNRCNVTTGEGGSIDEEWVYRNALDRTTTMAEAWMGLTAGCCVCHDHKFDPLPSKDYYSMYAFFHSSADPPLDGNALLTPPSVKLATAADQRKLADLDAQIAAKQKLLDERSAALAYTDPIRDKAGLAGRSDPGADPRRSLLAWWKQQIGKDTPGTAADLNAAIKAGPDKPPTPELAKRIRMYYLQNVCLDTKPQVEPLVKELTALTQQRGEFDKSIPSTFIYRDLDRPRESFVMLRGQYNKPGQKVEPGVFAVLPPLKRNPPERRANRLDLAQWLVTPEHPLTARVTVNRFWQQFFGVGLVKTGFDFGSQGETPSHPELLDWLAVSFREGGWKVKNLVRLMLTSATFRQSSVVSRELVKRDPDNRLLARGPRIRLDAEQLRDNALFVSGLLNPVMGGRGSNPYQPPNIWEPVGFVGSNTANYKQDHGPALYRRSIYVFLKRTAPPPFMANFDAPNREMFCTVRDRSNTPLQALQLMNDVQQFEAARVLAERLLTEGGPTPQDRIALGYRTVLARRPAPEETAVADDMLKKFLAKYQKHPEAAKQVVRNGESPPKPGLPEPELAAYTLLANMLLNLDETIMRN